MKPLNCAHCGGTVPKEHGVYANAQWYQAVRSGERPVFCTKGHGTAYRHAHESESAKEKRIAKSRHTRISRSPEEKQKSADKLRATYAAFSEEKKQDIQQRTYRSVVENLGGYAGIAKKREATLIERYGEDYGKKRQAVYKETCLAKYGAPNTLCVGTTTRDLADRVIEKKYGSKHIAHNPLIAAKSLATCIERHGGRGNASPTASRKYKETCLEKFGHENPMHNKEVAAKAAKSFRDNDGARRSLATKRKNGTTSSEVSWKGHETKKKNGTYITSKPELYIKQKLHRLLGSQVIYLYRDRENYPWEADFYDPDSDTIYEFQGYFTHGGVAFDKHSKKHLEKVRKLKISSITDQWASQLTLRIWREDDPAKRRACKKHGIHFVEWFSLEEFDLWYEAQVAQKLKASAYKKGCFKVASRFAVTCGSPYLEKVIAKHPATIVLFPWDDLHKVSALLEEKKKVGARETRVEEITPKLANRFCDKYHLQGSCKGVEYAVGLRLEGRLVAVMTFGKPRYNSKFDHELLRLCFSATLAVSGGASKMWAFAIKHLSGTILSYCDLSKFSGAVYEALGFTRSKKPRPSTTWYNPYTGRRITDNLLRARGFDQLVGNELGVQYNKGSNNETLMKKHGFTPVHDQGQATFIYSS